MARILTSYYKPKPGGLCTRYFRSINALLARGHEVHYLAVERFPIDHPACHYHRFPWPSGRADGPLFWAVFHLLAPPMLLLIGIRYRVERAYAFATTYAFALQPLRTFLRIPLTVFLRADVITNHRLLHRPRALLWLEHAIETLAINRACVYAVSQTLANEIASRHHRLRPKTLSTLTNNIEDRGMPLRSPPTTRIRYACVGVLEPRKNIETAIRAFAHPAFFGSVMTIYGDGPQRAVLEHLTIELNLSQRVIFAGWVPRAALWDQIDVLLFPSRHEGISNAICEALAHGVPVLASDIPEHRELLPTATLIADSVAQWSDAMQKLMHHDEWLAYQQTQQAFSMPYRFDWDEALAHTIMTCSG